MSDLYWETCTRFKDMYLGKLSEYFLHHWQKHVQYKKVTDVFVIYRQTESRIPLLNERQIGNRSGNYRKINKKVPHSFE